MRRTGTYPLDAWSGTPRTPLYAGPAQSPPMAVVVLDVVPGRWDSVKAEQGTSQLG